MSVLTQLTVPGEARPLKIALEAMYTPSFLKFLKFYILLLTKNNLKLLSVFSLSNQIKTFCFVEFKNKYNNKYNMKFNMKYKHEI